MRWSPRQSCLLTLLAASAAWAEPVWREIQAPHLVLRTDLDSEAARDTAVAIERARAEIIAAVWPGAILPGSSRIEMTVFAAPIEFEPHFAWPIVYLHDAPFYVAIAGSPDTWDRRTLPRTPETTSTFRHELVHVLAATVYRRQPHWFAEGLSEFLETMRPGPDGKTLELGAVNLYAERKYHSVRSLRVPDALGWSARLAQTASSATVSGLEGLSWMMVHWLFNEHPAQLEQFEVLLAKGVDPDKAWNVIRPGLNTANVDEALNQYAKHGEYREVVVPFTTPEIAVKEVILGQAEVRTEHARVELAAVESSWRGERHVPHAAREISEALRLDPANANALLLQLHQAPPAERASLARRLTQTHSEDWRAWFVLGQALEKEPTAAAEREAAFRRALSLQPEDPRTLIELARVCVQQGNGAEASALVAKAVQLDPADPVSLDSLASVQALLGRCSAAAVNQARAIEGLTSRNSGATWRDLEGRLDGYRTRCGAAAAPVGTTR
jgi:tetratricopeptide (TPR) repeat protein